MGMLSVFSRDCEFGLPFCTQMVLADKIRQISGFQKNFQKRVRKKFEFSHPVVGYCSNPSSFF